MNAYRRVAKLVNRSVALTLALLGLVLLVVGPGTAGRVTGAVLVAGAVGVVAIGLLLELSFREQRERRREEQARRFFDRFGRWPRGNA